MDFHVCTSAAAAIKSFESGFLGKWQQATGFVCQFHTQNRSARQGREEATVEINLFPPDKHLRGFKGVKLCMG